MNICTNCNSFIHFLVVEKIMGEIFIMKEKENEILPNVSEDNEDDKRYVTQYACPHCETILFENDEIRAREFLEKI